LADPGPIEKGIEGVTKRVSRREFVTGAVALGAASLLGTPRAAVAEPPPEVTSIRLVHTPAICLAPQYLVEVFLKAEGFTEIEYVKLRTTGGAEAVVEGDADMSMWDVPGIIPTIDANAPLVILSGVHAGCYELMVHDGIETIRDLKGRSVGIYAREGGDHIMISSMLAYIGMNPGTDVRWVEGVDLTGPMQMFVRREVDAFLGFAPEPQELRQRGIGRALVNTTQDRPWSQYYCCAVTANRGFARQYPVATKRALRAFLKAADMCSERPVEVARYLVERDFEPRFEIALEVLDELPYKRWREANVEDTIRFHALRLHEVGMLRTAPNELVARSVDRRFLDEIRQELKA
jgi:NitT/TauT family transport system substrate-binding protein